MKKLWLLIFSVGFLMASETPVIKKQITVSTHQNENKVEVNVEVEKDQMTLTINHDGEENVYKVHLNNPADLEALEKELDKLDIDTNIMAFIMSEDDDVEEEDFQYVSEDKHPFSFNHSSKGYLGIRIQDITDQLREYFNVQGDGGVLVTEVIKDSPAEKAGLKAGDVVTKINDVRIGDSGELTQTVRNQAPESEVEITVIRKNREKVIKATLDSSDHIFSWFDNSTNPYHSHINMPNKMMKLFDHQWSDSSGDTCSLHQQMKMNFDTFIPEDGPKMMKSKMFLEKMNRSEMEKMKKDIEELQKEIQNLKNS